MPSMSFIGNWSDTDNYFVGTGLEGLTYSVGAVVAVGLGATHNQAICGTFSAAAGTGWQLRAPGPDWATPSGQFFQGQASTTALTQQRPPVTPISGLRRVIFICMTATAGSQILYVNGIQVSQNAGPAPAQGVSGIRIGRESAAGNSCDVTLINSVFFTASILTPAMVQDIYQQYLNYGRIPPSGVVGGATIQHFWDVENNKNADLALWPSYGSVGALNLTLIGTAGTLTVSAVEPVWGW